ncbi:MAG TPA: glycoside hydrolase family 15 protein [Anaeromyxobacter sp.]|nr:glycoside hydrolase family 15 protein [Anaeromyxobacter sp.]
MALPIEDYALLGDLRTAALVGRDGSVDWLPLPRFDSGACFAALLGDASHGRWLLAPLPGTVLETQRRYRGATLVLETTFRTRDGVARVVDCMPPGEERPDLVRVVEGVEGTVAMRMELALRFDYGWIVPWVQRRGDALHAVAGPDAVVLRTPVPTRGEGLTTVARFDVHAGEKVPFELCWHRSHEPAPPQIDPVEAVAATERWWRGWGACCAYDGPWREAVTRSFVVLKALTYAPTGGIVAAPTTSLPEWIGGVRNWDYRYCWLRDATYALYALLVGGFRDEAAAWREWLVRTVAGDPAQLQIMYGVAGERRLTELTLPWLPGYEGSAPVRVGNGAVHQLQLDVYGEVLDALHQARRKGLEYDPNAWRVQQAILHHLEGAWRQPDEGIWEVRGPRQHFTHSKVMTWVAFDRAVKAVERFGRDGPPGGVDRWRALRDEIHADVCRRAWNPEVGAFTQAYGSRRLDAALLLLPVVGFLPHRDPRIEGTVRAIERELVRDGLVLRYVDDGADGLPPGEGVFLLCSFWLADHLALSGRVDEARALFERLLALRNDVGLLAEEYDPAAGRLLGNFPQAFSHIGVVNTAFNLTQAMPSPTQEREED